MAETTPQQTNERISVKLLKWLLGIAIMVAIALWQRIGEWETKYDKLRDKYEEDQRQQTATALRIADLSEQLRKGTAYLVKVTNDSTLQRRLDSATHVDE